MCRNRAGKRLRKIQALLEHLDWDKARVTEEVEAPHLLAPDVMGDRPGLHPRVVRAVTETTTSLPPQFSEVNFFKMEPLDIVPCGTYSELALADLEVPFEYMCLGYKREDHFGWEEYIPDMQHMELESGAAEDEVEDVPCAAVASYTPEEFEDDFAQLPSAAMRSAAHVESIGGKWLRTQTGVVAAELPVWGMGPEYLPEPVELARRCCAEREALESGTLRAMAGLPLLSEVWWPRNGNAVLDEAAGAAESLPWEQAQESAMGLDDVKRTVGHLHTDWATCAQLYTLYVIQRQKRCCSALQQLCWAPASVEPGGLELTLLTCKQDHGITMPIRLPTKAAVGKWLPANIPNNLDEGEEFGRSVIDKFRIPNFDHFSNERKV